MAESTSSTRLRIAEVFKALNAGGRGVGRKDFAGVAAALDPAWTDQRISEVLDAAGIPGDGALDIEKLLEWVFSESPAGAGGDCAPAKSPLAAHFLSQDYSLGLKLSAAGTGYIEAVTDSGTPVYLHEASGVQVWQEALEFGPAGGEGELRVFFRYASLELLDALAASPGLTPELWASLREPGGACEMLASGVEPAALAGRALCGGACCIPVLAPAGMVARAPAEVAAGATPGGAAEEDAWLVRGERAKQLLKANIAARERRKRRVLQHCQGTLGEGDIGTLEAANDLIFFLEAINRLPEAAALCRDAKEAAERCFGTDHPHTLAALNNLAYLVEQAGDLLEAEALARQGLECRKRVLGSTHADTMTSIFNLAKLLEAAMQLDEAEQLFQQELAWCRETYGARAAQTRESTRNMNRFWEKHKRGSFSSKKLDKGMFKTSS